jgi:hypothetical protein
MIRQTVLALARRASVVRPVLVAACAAGCGSGGGSDAPTTPTAPSVTQVTVTPVTASVQVGSTVTLSAAALGANGTAMSASITWSSSDNAIATVSGGVVTGVKAGSATIRAAAGSVSGSASVTVTDVPVATLSLNSTLDTVFTPVTRQYVAVAKDASGNTLSGRTLTWATSDANVATVSASGLATARGAGTATISATVDGARATAQLVVKANPVYATSYENFKNAGASPLATPTLPGGVYDLLARGLGDFFGRGDRTDLFMARIVYRIEQPLSQAVGAVYSFYRRQGAQYVEDNSILVPPTSTCLHPRKAVVADFNMDGRPDVFVACHGYDTAPFPGEKSQVILSQPDRRYKVSDATAVGFWHGASAADLNGDGYPDVVLANNFDTDRAVVLLNNRDGTFTREASGRLPMLTGANYFSVELADVNEDGRADLLLGGHEWEGGATTRIWLNPGNGQFKDVSPVTVPAVANEGVVLDFLLTGTGASRTLWLSRTSGGDGTFYQSAVLQKFDWTSRTSQTVVNTRPALWVPWLLRFTRNGQVYVGSDDPRTPIEFAVP